MPTIEIQTPDGPAEAYLARPDEEAHPGVLLYMDAIGLRPRIEEMADRIASWGYVVLAPNVFHRDGRAADLAPRADLRVPENREAFFVDAMRRVRALTPDQAERDARRWVEALLERATAPIGVTGYCMGVRLAIRTAGLPYLNEVYAGAAHGYSMADAAPYDEAATERHFAELEALLARTLGDDAVG